MFDYRKTVSASIDAIMYTELAHMSVSVGRPLASLVREALAEYLVSRRYTPAGAWSAPEAYLSTPAPDLIPGQMVVDDVL